MLCFAENWNNYWPASGRYVAVVIRKRLTCAKKNKIGYANWNYKCGSFGLIDGDGIRKEDFIKIVLGK